MRGALLTCSFLAACGGGAADGPHLRSGVVTVAPSPVLGSIPQIQGVARNGMLLVVIFDNELRVDSGLVSTSYFTPGLAYSRDGGATWSRPPRLALTAAPNGVADRLPTGVLIRNGDVYVMTPAEAGALGQLVHLFVERVDLESGVGTPVGELPEQVVVDDDGTILWLEPSPTPHWVRWDPAVGAEVETIPLAPGAGFACIGPYQHESTDFGTLVAAGCMTTTDAGAHWSYCYDGGVLRSMTGEGGVVQSTWEAGVSCAAVPAGVSISARLSMGAIRGGVYVDGAMTRFGYVEVTEDGPVFRSADIGPGTPYQPISENRNGPDADRWGGLVAVQASGPGAVTLYRQLRGAVFVATDVPTTACPDGAAECGRPLYVPERHEYVPVDQILWAEVRGDDALIFYAADLGTSSGTAPDVGIVVARTSLDTAKATPGGELERACARASACQPPGVGFDIESCVLRWLSFSAGGDREAFLAASTCDELRAVQPGIIYGCGDGGADSCASAPPERCACEGDGSACCWTASALCDGRPPGATLCDGEVATSCQVSGALPEFDCGGIDGLACDPTPGEVCTFGPPTCATEGAQRCDGTKVRYCLFQSVREVDCHGLGGTCADGRCSGGIAPPTPEVTTPPPPPTCDAPALVGGPVSETPIVDYPTATGGALRDGTYVLTRFELWSSATQPYTHRETLRVTGGAWALATEHSALGTTLSSGALATDGGTLLTLTADCPAAATRAASYSATDTTLVLLEGAQVRTFTRQP